MASGDGNLKENSERLPNLGENGDFCIEYNRQRDSKWVYHNCQPDVQSHKDDDPYGGYPDENNAECLNCGAKIPEGIRNLCKLMNK